MLAISCPVEGTWDDDHTTPKVPLCAMTPTFVKASRQKENQATLKFGRDSNWPLKTTAASVIDEFTSLSTTYEIEWGECDSSIAGCRREFTESRIADGLTHPPVSQGNGASWDITLRKENNSMRILLREVVQGGSRKETLEEPGLPSMILYAPKAVVKLRSTADDAMQWITNCVGTLCQGRLSIT
jgi:hypothetical protein